MTTSWTLTVRPALVFTAPAWPDWVVVELSCRCGAHARMFRDDWEKFGELEEEDRWSSDLLLECQRCEVGYELAEREADNAAEEAWDLARGDQAELAHGTE